MSKKKPHGGKRKGAGPKPKYTEPTIMVTFRVPESTAPIITEAVKEIVKPYLIKKDE